MNCFEETELVIDYIENNIFDVSPDKISKITGVPYSLYHRIFSYVCGISAAEYIRRRKLTLAAKDILGGLKRVTEAALDYGYNTPSAFTRAFKEQFGVPPKSVTEDIYNSKSFRRFSFHENETYYVMKGKRIMADLVKIEYEEVPELLIIGVGSGEYGASGRKLWDVYFGGFDKKLQELEEEQIGMEDCIGVGYLTDFEHGDETGLGKKYIVGKYFKPNTSVPEGMTGEKIRAGIIAKAQVKGKNFNDILNNSYILIKDMVERNGYSLDYRDFYWTEVYTVSRYAEPIEAGSKEIILDWYMPCIRKN